MDACLTVEREQDRLAKKYTNIKEHTDSSLTELINQITSIQEELSKGKNKVLFFLRSVCYKIGTSFGIESEKKLIIK